MVEFPEKEEGLSAKRAAKWARTLQPADWKAVGATQDIHELPRITSITSPHRCLLGLKHKRKHSFIGMEALALLTLIGNLELIWYRRALALDELGIKRFIRDVIKSPGFVTSGRSGLRVDIAPEATYFQKLNAWKPQIDLPLYLLETGTILYKN